MTKPTPYGDRIPLLCLIELPPQARVLLERDFELKRPAADGLVPSQMSAELASCRGIVTGYRGRVEADLIGALPALELIACFTAGRDMVDSTAAAARGVAIWSNGAALAESVADLALALILALARDVRGADQHVRSGAWVHARFPSGALLSGARIGIAGYGMIGQGIARRARGFGMEIGCFSRSAPDETELNVFPDIGSLAKWADWLVLALPGTPETHHLIGADVLAQLGAQGRLVNVARGSIVDEAALVAALRNRVIAGAALDVFSNEPNPDRELLAQDNLLLSPHQGSNTHEALAHRSEALAAKLRDFFFGSSRSLHSAI